MKFDHTIFESILKEPDSSESLKPQDITESIHFDITDDKITNDNCKLIAYNVHVDESDDVEAYNPKNNPEKAIDIFLDYPEHNLKIEIFLDTESREWDSYINGQTKLSPEQMNQFFKTNFFNRLKNRLNEIWTKDDDFFGNLLEALNNKKYKIDWDIQGDLTTEDAYQFKQHNIKKGKAREKNAAGEQIRTNSGRLIINFQDLNVKKGQHEEYYSWPGHKPDDKFRWSRWKEWEKQKPLMRCRFAYGIGVNNDIIGLSLSPFEEDDSNRGFIAYNLSLKPILQYLTPQETQDILNLSIIRRFVKESVRRISEVLDIPDEEIYRNINNPEKITIGDIRKTKQVLKNTLKAAKESRVNNFIYT